jgi:Tol biopolymer transport system component
MEPERWHKVESIFNRVLDAGVNRRESVLRECCAGDEDLRREVESLLAQHEVAGKFIEAPAFVAVASAASLPQPRGAENANKGAVAANAVIGHYRILRKIGSGGMGTVYEAEDIRLRRSVALKFLPEEFAEDAHWVQRFRIEARAASALNHAHICTIYEVDEVEGRLFIAMELLKGQTLKEMIAGKPLPVKTILDLGVQIAAGIDAAHSKGIVHRDIKPANIFVTRQRQVKILDFGIAKLTRPHADPDETASDLAHHTRTGMVLGTVGYMSPEQVRGEAVDHHSDIFSFGAILYEMLTGRRAFEKPTAPETMSAILNEEPPELSQTAPSAPLGLQRVVQRCLEKNPAQRFQSAADLAFALQALTESGTSAAVGAVRKPRSRWAWVTAVGALAAVGLAAAIWYLHRPPPAPVVPAGITLDHASLTQVTASSGADRDPSLSPDGSLLAYSSSQNGSFEIYVKSLAPGGREMQLTSDGGQNFQPAWSPDGKLIAYYSQKRGGIWLIPALGGTARLLASFGSNPAWSPDGTKIAFQSAETTDLGQTTIPNSLPSSTLWIVASQGGAPVQLTRPGNPSGGHSDPVWSPDGKRIIFNAESLNDWGVWSVSASGSEPQRLLPLDGFDLVYAPNGKALYFLLRKGRSWHLMRATLSPSGSLVGDPEMIENTGKVLYRRLRFSADGRFAAFSEVSSANSLQSVRVSPATGMAIGVPELLTHDTNGRKIGPRFSPDGKKIAFWVGQTGVWSSEWLVDPDGKNARQLDATPDSGVLAGWSPDSRRIVYIGYQNGHMTLESLDIDSGIKAHLRDLGDNDSFYRLSPDGKQIAFNHWQDGVLNVWTQPVEGGPAKQLTFDKEGIGYPIWAPDGKSIIAESHPSSGSQIVWIPSDGGAPVQLTHDPGESFPRGWSPDGDKIVFAGLRDGIWNIYWVSRRTGAEKQITHYAKANAFVRYPDWSPRGDQIVYEYSETNGNIWLMRVK